MLAVFVSLELQNLDYSPLHQGNSLTGNYQVSRTDTNYCYNAWAVFGAMDSHFVGFRDRSVLMM